jgi:hypothetical protein
MNLIGYTQMPGTRACWKVRSIARCTVLSIVLAVLALNDSRAQTVAATRTVIDLGTVHRNIDMKIDGRLDEAVWQSLPTIGTFLTVEPDTLVPEKHTTELRMFYTEEGLYVGFRMQQPRDTLVSRLSSRDLRQLNRDAVFITLDSSADGHYGYWFGIALGGSLMDGTILPERRPSSDWDGPWRGETMVTADGWNAEMFLPWSMMTMPTVKDKRHMGVYVSRKVAYLNERWGWPALPETQPKFMSVLDRLQMDGIAPVQQYSVFPYASVTHDNVKDDVLYKAGVDIFWRPSTDFQFTTTLNPDFGTIEADDVIVNLSAIETFFPEKRLFFLEGREIFVAAPRATSETPTTLLNTRRIGSAAYRPVIPGGIVIPRNELTQPVELLGAVKATGENGKFRYGVLAAMEDETRFDGVDLLGQGVSLDQDGRDFGVARAIYEDSTGGGYRAVGWMNTFVNHPQRTAAVYAVDTHWLSRNGKWQWDNQLLVTDIDVDQLGTGAIDDSGEDVGGYIDGRYSPQRGINHLVAFEYYGKKTNINDLGFFRRNDLIGTRYIFNKRSSNTSLGRDVFFQILVPHEWNTDWQVVRTGVFTEGFIIRDNLHELRYDLNYFPRRHEDRNSFGNGAFRIEKRMQYALGYSTDTSKRVAALFDWRWEGEELGGHLTSYQAQAVWRPLDRMTSDLTVYYRERNGWLLHQIGRSMATYDAEEWNVRVSTDFFLTAKQHFRASLQWVGIKASEEEYFLIPTDAGHLIPVANRPINAPNNFPISTVNFQLRYRWEIAPMSDLFVVYTKNSNQRGLPPAAFTNMFNDAFENPISEQLVVKLRYRFGS